MPEQQTVFTMREAARRQLVKAALEEDLGTDFVDLTAAAVEGLTANCTVIAKANGVFAGSWVPDRVLSTLLAMQTEGEYALSDLADDGTQVSAGDVVFGITGSMPLLLTAERTILNICGHLSGVATLTRSFVDAAGSGIVICDTRKTLPGMRIVQKDAVLAGGGTNHRMGLFDMAMLKDTHIDAAGSIPNAVARIRAQHPDAPLAIETRTIEEVKDAVRCHPTIIMLDNMDRDTMTQAIQIIRKADGDIEIEVTGGVTLKSLPILGDLDIDRVSIGMLTHSAPALDLSCQVTQY